jgi:putative transposase
MPSVVHSSEQYENNRAEVSNEPTRQQERLIRGLKSIGHAQRFLSVHAEMGNLFRLGRHLAKARYYREMRSRTFAEWQQVSCAW